MTRESALQANCISYAEKQGILAVNMHGGGWTNKGFPDLLLFRDGKCVPVELKDGTAYKVQPSQRIWMKRFAKAGIGARAALSLDEFKQIIREEFR